MTRLEELTEVTNKIVVETIKNNIGTAEERQTKIIHVYLADIARSLAMIADTLAGNNISE